MLRGLFFKITSLLRVEQWIKNLLIFLPAFFAQQFAETDHIISLSLGFLAFSLASGAIYIFNDYKDIDYDRNHPQKSDRPLASGKVSLRIAFYTGIISLLASGILVMLIENPQFAYVLFAYVILNIFYTLYLKKVPIIDLSIVGIGFLLRIFAGAFLVAVPVSQWLGIMIFLGALLIGLGKRMDDVILNEDGNAGIRESIPGYNRTFIQVSMVFATSVTTVSYIIYTVSPEVTERIGSDFVYLTSIFVILGMLKYLQLVFVFQDSGQPTKLFLQNRSLQLIILCWFLCFAYLLYWP